MLGVEGEDARMDARYVYLPGTMRTCASCQRCDYRSVITDRCRMLKDDREKTKPQRSLFAEQDITGKIDQRQTR